MDRSRTPGKKFWRFLTEPLWFVIARTGRASDFFSFNRSFIVGWGRVYVHIGSWNIIVGLPFFKKKPS